MYAIDTNVLIRYIVEDNPEQAQKATEAIEPLTTEKQGFISCIVLCELNWVLIVVPIQFRSAAILAATREQDAPTTFRLLFFIWNHYKTAYKISKRERVATLQKILSVPVFKIEQLDCCLKALRSYEKGEADFSDYLIQQIGEKYGYEILLTFDQKASRETGFQCAF
ncbi:type II toxin-antitoxin system VapC family toxin [Euhalothece natronophila Z-M001]|uniref:Type II toxin-antitoxin system VapC family toxin n=1 Tax=Euhalothece natronophila Z-M001 TaxID=522448 RepID=A0A5B8NQQ4_9CHRO|nr:type II toxin-antitoxin system VapC family toxin [Euhalothece natronophila]QDZ40599.1 type II toxin-antitoxin system VapC family toxin [Euhalothece natronophila Z-M001]